MATIGSKRSYALTWCMPNNDDDDDAFSDQNSEYPPILRFVTIREPKRLQTLGENNDFESDNNNNNSQALSSQSASASATSTDSSQSHPADGTSGRISFTPVDCAIVKHIPKSARATCASHLSGLLNFVVSDPENVRHWQAVLNWALGSSHSGCP